MTKTHQEILDFTKELVATPSQNGIDSEKAVAELVRSKLTNFGLKPTIIGSKEHPSVMCSAGKGGGKTIWLESSLDTVAAGDKGQWTHPPFKAEIEDGRMFGRGVADAKIGTAIFCYLAKTLVESNEFNGTIFLGFDANEQSGQFSGIRDVMKQAPKADVCILGYQGIDKISIGARGWLRLKLTTHGEAAHTGSSSKRGINAVHCMARAINALLQIDFKKSELFFEFGSSIQVAKISGGEAINVVPDKCEAWIDIRLIPSLQKEDALAEINSSLKGLLDKEPEFRYSLEELQNEVAYLSDPNHAFIQMLKSTAEETLGREVPLRASSQGSVGNVISQLGVPIINAFGCESGNVHAPDEWVKISDVPKVFEIYRKSIIKFCTDD